MAVVRARMLLAVLLLVVPALAGCGGSGSDGYCSTLKDDRAKLTRLARGSGGGHDDVVATTLQVFQDLRADAPEDIQDEWATLVYAWQTLAAALHQAHVDPSTYHLGRPPKGVSPHQQRAIRQAAEELRSPRVLDAGRAVEQQARDVCGVDLGL